MRGELLPCTPPLHPPPLCSWRIPTRSQPTVSTLARILHPALARARRAPSPARVGRGWDRTGGGVRGPVHSRGAPSRGDMRKDTDALSWAAWGGGAFWGPIPRCSHPHACILPGLKMNEPTAAESPCRRGAALHTEQHRPLLQMGQSRARGDPPGTPIPMHPAPSPGPTGGPSSPRSPTPAACRPPGVPVPCSWAAQPPAPLTPPLPPRRALALSGGGGAGAGPWASAGAEDGVFPALSRSCCCLSSASPARCEGERWALRSRVGFRVVQGRGCWWGRGGRGGFRCPPLGGVTPQHGALSALEGMKRHQAGGKGALGGVPLAPHGLRPPHNAPSTPNPVFQLLCSSRSCAHRMDAPLWVCSPLGRAAAPQPGGHPGGGPAPWVLPGDGCAWGSRLSGDLLRAAGVQSWGSGVSACHREICTISRLGDPHTDILRVLGCPQHLGAQLCFGTAKPRGQAGWSSSPRAAVPCLSRAVLVLHAEPTPLFSLWSRGCPSHARLPPFFSFWSTH